MQVNSAQYIYYQTGHYLNISFILMKIILLMVKYRVFLFIAMKLQTVTNYKETIYTIKIGTIELTYHCSTNNNELIIHYQVITNIPL